jgi:uncharacterized glyoxalase superfamily protein PhnB
LSDTYKPKNHNALSPYLIIPKADETIRFMVDVFGADELNRIVTDDGRVRHAEVRIDDSVVMLGESSKDWPPVPGYLHLYVPDVDAAYQLALQHGAESLQEPKQNEGDADRRGGVKDSQGNTWWIATKVE